LCPSSYLPHTTGCSLPGRFSDSPTNWSDGWVNAYRLESKFVLILGIWNPWFISVFVMCVLFSNRILVWWWVRAEEISSNRVQNLPESHSATPHHHITVSYNSK
jgi:hypothetical protein